MNRCLFICVGLLLAISLDAQQEVKLKKKDRRRDVEMVTTKGTMVMRLSDATPEHRDNFLKLVRRRYYDSVLFHRVIRHFMIQGGDPDSRRATATQALGNGGPGYTLPAEFRPGLFHKKGALAAARNGDAMNPEKRSSGSQFYLVQGRVWTDQGLDSVETFRLKRKLPQASRQVYKTIGGSPHLDSNYTVFGEVIRGLEIIDSIAAEATSRNPPDRPVNDVRIIKTRLIKRKNK